MLDGVGGLVTLAVGHAPVVWFAAAQADDVLDGHGIAVDFLRCCAHVHEGHLDVVRLQELIPLGVSGVASGAPCSDGGSEGRCGIPCSCWSRLVRLEEEYCAFADAAQTAQLSVVPGHPNFSSVRLFRLYVLSFK